MEFLEFKDITAHTLKLFSSERTLENVLICVTTVTICFVLFHVRRENVGRNYMKNQRKELFV